MYARKKPTLSKRLLLSILFFFTSLGLLFTAQNSSSFSDWYTAHIYPLLVNTIGRFFGLFPFSFVEMALYAAILFWIGYLIRSIMSSLRAFLAKRGRFSNDSPDKSVASPCSVSAFWKNLGQNFLLFATSLFLSYTLCCGINYGHISFSESAGLEPSPYSAEELTRLCDYLTGKVNHLAPQMARNDEGVSVMENEEKTCIPKKAQSAMQNLGTLYPEMEGYYPLPKPLQLSYILSIQNLSGVYSPFTIEANYNSDMTDYNQPFTACHELSHLRGFMQEEEANFLAFLACIHADDAQFQYSGYLLGWLYATNQLYHADYSAYEKICDKLDKQALVDLRANDAFWNQYDGRVAEVTSQVNDSYLKANGQSDGVVSYDRMVDLMMAYDFDSDPQPPK